MTTRSNQTEEWDEEAFRALYEKTARPLWAYVARLTQNPNVADDILQQAYLNVLESKRARQLDSDHQKNYLFKVATNLVHDHFRSVQKLESTEDVELISHVTESDHDLERILAQLVTRDRKLLLLAYIEGFSHKEIAQMLGYTAASVRPLLARARDRVIALLHQNGLHLARGRKRDGREEL